MPTCRAIVGAKGSATRPQVADCPFLAGGQLRLRSGERRAQREGWPNRGSRRLPTIVLQHPAQALAAFDRAFGKFLRRFFLAEAAEPRLPTA